MPFDEAGGQPDRLSINQPINPEDQFHRIIYRITHRSILHHLSLSISLTAIMAFKKDDNVIVEYYGMVSPLSRHSGLVLNLR